MADKVEVLLYSFTDCGFYSEEDLQTYRLNIYIFGLEMFCCDEKNWQSE
jgi:hypothetical protein